MNKKIQILTFTSSLLLFLSSPSIAVIDTYKGAIDAYGREDYKTAYKLMLPLADQGVAKAQEKLILLSQKNIKSKSQDAPKGLVDNSLNLNAKSIQNGVDAFNKKDYKTTS